MDDMDRERVALAGSERTAPAARLVGPAAEYEQVEVTIVLRRRAELPDPAADTRPPSRRSYVDRATFAERYGARPEDIAAVEAFAREAGLQVVSADAARRTVVMRGTVAAMNAAFGTQVQRYAQGDAQFRGRTGALTVPAALAPAIVAVLGLDERPQARTQFRRVRRPRAVTLSYTPPQIAQLYDFPSGADGKGETIALIELGGGYVQSDLDAYFRTLGLPTPTVVSVPVDGAANAPSGDANGPDGEVMLDVEVAGAVAPGATIVVYFAPNTDKGFLDAITTAVHDTTHAPSIVSISWGGPESSWTQQAFTSFDQAFVDAAALGVTVCVASGDGGSDDGVGDGRAHVDFPASSPHVLACGGTTLYGSGAVISGETVWNDGSQGGASGGGVSDAFPLPSWQSSVGVPPSANAGGRVGRGVPDVCGDADPATGYSVRVDGSNTVIGGTSAVAPLWAGLLALINQRRGKPSGFVNALLYAHAQALRDVTSGSNGAYAAGPGWDACTGLGSPDGAQVAIALGA
ncbi:MAG TPA: S53 family peptidase [Candidatus Limnocylindria bacterium]|nr:S53 family peptidase [Candidatus Limnocylindria bacterium]